MKFRITLFCVLVILLSCKKKNEPEPVPEEVPVTPAASPSNYFMPQKGNYWVYQTVLIYEDGTENLMYRDSVVAERDTIIRGRVFRMFVSYNNDNTKILTKFLTDSLHYIISPDAVIFSSGDTTHFLKQLYYLNSVTDTFATLKTKMAPGEKDCTVPAGTFRTKDAVGVFYTWPKYVQPGFKNPRFQHLRYAPGIGLMQESLFFSATMWSQEKRLIRYKVQ